MVNLLSFIFTSSQLKICIQDTEDKIYDKLWDRDEQYEDIQNVIYYGFDPLLDLYNKQGEIVEDLEAVIEGLTQEKIQKSKQRGISKRDQLIEELKNELSESHKKSTETNDKLDEA